ncbi:carboxypeptidase-like regulatory domain-containing protein [Mucilaginibacter sp.]|uniref:carboxypeptidase-like regulatory domain-containing protein n=1 Tax=Mucilaginibacter sp. TaxID=1882438 RepID=UPI00285276F9|nr:hypothetical protein [Mucilaginibacter sp.]
MCQLNRCLFLLICIAFCLPVYAQKVTGLVIDRATKQPISGVAIKAALVATRSNQLGQFEITISHPDDSLKIIHPGYQTRFVAAGKPNVLLTIELTPTVNNLNEVTIYGDRNFKKDSLANRADYARQFNYKGPRVIDAFTNGANFSPGEFFSINLLTLIQALTKKSTPEYKFNKLLIRDEHEQFVDEHFNRGIVSGITPLKGDTLAAFLLQYRPGYDFAKKSTDYDMEVYIRACFKKFKDAGYKNVDPVLPEADKTGGEVKLN